MTDKIKSWEAAYRKRPSGEDKPHEDADHLHEIFQRNEVKKILDLGCGDGRHLVYFAEHGYRVSGFDYAPTALKRAREWLSKENLDASLFCANMNAIPCADNAFDAIVCIAVINHNRMPEIRKTIQEIYRVLRLDGWLFIVVATDRAIPNLDKAKYVLLEHHTYMPVSGHEKGVPHYFFSEEELREEFSQFSIHDIHPDQRNRVCVLMQKQR